MFKLLIILFIINFMLEMTSLNPCYISTYVSYDHIKLDNDLLNLAEEKFCGVAQSCPKRAFCTDIGKN